MLSGSGFFIHTQHIVPGRDCMKKAERDTRSFFDKFIMKIIHQISSREPHFGKNPGAPVSVAKGQIVGGDLSSSPVPFEISFLTPRGKNNISLKLFRRCGQ
jgi:hypothetical protein